MFNKKYEERLAIWRKFRNNLEISKDPIQDTIEFYLHAPMSLVEADPYTPSTWPNPWELLQENNYCPFVKILAIYYTLQLTNVLSKASYEIHIIRDNENSEAYYLLYVNDSVIGFTRESYVQRSELPPTLRSEHVHSLQPQQ